MLLKVCIFVIIIVLQTIASEKATSKLRRKLIIPKLNEQCKKIKCSATEEPQCVKLTRHDLNHTFHIVVINKCELEYIKCHDDVEAKLVPMKFCGHGNGLVKAGNNKKNKTATAGHIRVKRQLSEHKKSKDVPKKLFGTHPKLVKNKLSNMVHKGKNLKKDKKTKSADKKKSVLRKGKGRISRSDIHYGGTSNEYSRELLPSDESGDSNRYYLNGEEKDAFPMMSNETRDNIILGLNETDRKMADATCPSVCPTRDVLVCAKCQHGIYKTFLSTCHMRMFSCRHRDEELTLISRYPCVLSAPYLSEQGMRPRGRVVEAGDDDKVLRFIMCRDKEKLGTAMQKDWRCNPEPELKKELKWWRGSDPGHGDLALLLICIITGDCYD